MKKRMMRCGIAAVLAGLTVWAAAMTAYAGAGTWVQDGTGWRWRMVPGDYPANQWLWIDGNDDGTAECYYFGGNGYLLTGTTTPDGFLVNANGAWEDNGVVQTKASTDPGVIVGGTASAEAVQTNQNTKDAVEMHYGTTYDEWGVSIDAKNMLDNTRAENALIYPEAQVLVEEDEYGTGWEILYQNGIRIEYIAQSTVDSTNIIRPHGKKAFSNDIEIFKYLNDANTKEEAASVLKNHGYREARTAEKGTFYYNDDEAMLKIALGDNYSILWWPGTWPYGWHVAHLLH